MCKLVMRKSLSTKTWSLLNLKITTLYLFNSWTRIALTETKLLDKYAIEIRLIIIT